LLYAGPANATCQELVTPATSYGIAGLLTLSAASPTASVDMGPWNAGLAPTLL
jgi:hypothetical protein